MVQQEIEVINIRNILYVLFLFIISCNNNDLSNYSVRVHYQYVVFKPRDNGKASDVYIEQFFNIKNNSNDTLKISIENFKNNYKLMYRGVKKTFVFSSESTIIIYPYDSIDLNCAVNLEHTVKNIPAKVDAKKYRTYDILSKKYLSNCEDYQIIKTRNFGVFQER